MAPTNGLLVVDNGSALASALVKYFDYEGFTAFAARDAKEALSRLKSGPFLPQAILIDLDAACNSEHSLLDELQNNPAWTSIPVIVVKDPGDCKADSILHAQHIFEKPVAIENLVTVLSQYCRRAA